MSKDNEREIIDLLREIRDGLTLGQSAPMPTRKVIRIELEKAPEVTPEGVHRLVLAHAEQSTGHSGNRFLRCVFVTESLALVWGFLAFPEDAPAASWVWNNVVDHPKELEVGSIVYSLLTTTEYRGTLRSKIGVLYATREEAMKHA